MGGAWKTLLLNALLAHPAAEYNIKLHRDSSSSEAPILLPETNNHIYALWNEPDSNEPPACYLAMIFSILPDGFATLWYCKGNSTETLDLLEINWALAQG